MIDMTDSFSFAMLVYGIGAIISFFVVFVIKAIYLALKAGKSNK